MIGDKERQDWPEDEVNKLKELALRNLTARDIGNMMGRTRNSIIGKCRRMGIPLPRARTEPYATRRIRVVARRPTMVVKKVAQTTEKRRPNRPRPSGWDRPITEPIVPVNDGAGITILELSHSENCHTVVGSTRPDTGLVRYCGRPAWNETDYCEDHFAVFHRPPQPR